MHTEVHCQVYVQKGYYLEKKSKDRAFCIHNTCRIDKGIQRLNNFQRFRDQPPLLWEVTSQKNENS